MQEIELIDFIGENTNVGKPPLIAAKVIKNLDIHEKPGVLTVRPGYDLLYSAPDVPADVLGNEFLTFDNFFDKQFNIDGQEITALYSKAIVVDPNATGAYVPAAKALLCWIRPYWDGSQWVDGWQWLNQVSVTSVTVATDATYENQIEIEGNHSVDQWTIINRTKQEISQVIKSTNVSTNTRIVHTLYGSTWEIDDEIVLMKNYIPIEVMEALYDDVLQEDFVFHKVNNDIRVGFGGYSKRNGISTGGRQKSFDIVEFDYTNVSPDIVGGEESFATYDEIILDPFNIFDTSAYGIDLTEVSGTLPQGKYYFRLTAVLDEVTETLVYEQDIITAGTNDIEIVPWIKLGEHNKRVTRLNSYWSADGLTYNLLSTYQISYDTYQPNSFKIDESGRLILIDPTPELHLTADAATLISLNEDNSVGNWVEQKSGGSAISSVAQGGVPSDYKLKIPFIALLLPGNPSVRKGAYIPLNGIETGTDYNIDVYLESTEATFDCYVFFVDENDVLISGDLVPTRPQVTQAITNTLTNYTFTLNSGSSQTPIVGLMFAYKRDDITSLVSPIDLFVDELSVISSIGSVLTNSTELGLEMSAKMGYEPTFNVMRAWDDVQLFNGRAYYLNPYIDQRYENFIIQSHINSDISYMIDVATLQEQLEIEKFDDQKSIAIRKIPGTYLIVFRDNGWLIVDPDTNQIIRNQFGQGCVSRRSIVDYENNIKWAGGQEVFRLGTFSGYDVKRLLEFSIRNKYTNLPNKNLLVGIRDKYDSYRLRAKNSTDKTEFLLTDRGWIEQTKDIFPLEYKVSFDEQNLFMNDGFIYKSKLSPESIYDCEYSVDSQDDYSVDSLGNYSCARILVIQDSFAVDSQGDYATDSQTDYATDNPLGV